MPQCSRQSCYITGVETHAFMSVGLSSIRDRLTQSDLVPGRDGGLLLFVGDTLALSPPLIVSESQIGEMFDKLARIIKAVA